MTNLPKIYPHYIPLEMRRSSGWLLWRLEDATRDGKPKDWIRR